MPGSRGLSAYRTRAPLVLHGRPGPPSAPCARASAASHQEARRLLRSVPGAHHVPVRGVSASPVLHESPIVALFAENHLEVANERHHSPCDVICGPREEDRCECGKNPDNVHLTPPTFLERCTLESIFVQVRRRNIVGCTYLRREKLAYSVRV